MNELETRLAMVEDENKSLRNLVQQMRDGIQSIYAMRGEDELISDICNPLIEKSRSAL